MPYFPVSSLELEVEKDRGRKLSALLIEWFCLILRAEITQEKGILPQGQRSYCYYR